MSFRNTARKTSRRLKSTHNMDQGETPSTILMPGIHSELFILFDSLVFVALPFCKLFSYFNICIFYHKNSTVNLLYVKYSWQHSSTLMHAPSLCAASTLVEERSSWTMATPSLFLQATTGSFCFRHVYSS